MSGRLSDGEVAAWADPANCSGPPTLVEAVLVALAREVQEYRALRPPCPTCDGKQWWRHVAQSAEGIEGDYVDPCPDCTDGKMPLPEWVALLVDALRMVASAAPGTAISAGLALGHADLVLKMAHRNDSTDTLIPMNDEVVS